MAFEVVNVIGQGNKIIVQLSSSDWTYNFTVFKKINDLFWVDQPHE